MSGEKNTFSNFGLSNGGDTSVFNINNLSDVLTMTKTKLQQAASSDDLFSQVFGNKANTFELQAVRSQWSVRNFSQLPSIQVLSVNSFNN